MLLTNVKAPGPLVFIFFHELKDLRLYQIVAAIESIQ